MKKNIDMRHCKKEGKVKQLIVIDNGKIIFKSEYSGSNIHSDAMLVREALEDKNNIMGSTLEKVITNKINGDII